MEEIKANWLLLEPQNPSLHHKVLTWIEIPAGIFYFFSFLFVNLVLLKGNAAKPNLFVALFVF